MLKDEQGAVEIVEEILGEPQLRCRGYEMLSVEV